MPGLWHRVLHVAGFICLDFFPWHLSAEILSMWVRKPPGSFWFHFSFGVQTICRGLGRMVLALPCEKEDPNRIVSFVWSLAAGDKGHNTLPVLSPTPPGWPSHYNSAADSLGAHKGACQACDDGYSQYLAMWLSCEQEASQMSQAYLVFQKQGSPVAQELIKDAPPGTTVQAGGWTQCITCCSLTSLIAEAHEHQRGNDCKNAGCGNARRF